MTLPSSVSARARGLEVGDRVGAESLVRARVSATTAQRVVAAAIVPMGAVTVWLALASEHLERPLASALYWGYLTAAPIAIGLCWWVRRPASRFGPLLVVFGVLIWVVGWESSDWPLVYDVAWLFEAPAVWLTFYLFLAFPMGRLEPAAVRWLTRALAVAVVAFYLPQVLFSPVVFSANPLAFCGGRCPENLLQLGSARSLLKVAEAAAYCVLAIAVAVLVVYVLRLRAASRPRRRALTAVAVTSLLFLPAFFVFNLSALALKLDSATLDTMAWSVVGSRVLLPLGFLVALLQAERFAARALKDLLERLGARPTPEHWRAIIAATLDDPSLRLGYYDADTGRFRESDGELLTRPAHGSGQAWVPVGRDGRVVAALVIDETLAEDPELVRVAALATLLAVENGALEGELRASRARILEAGDTERRRIERDLHDSTQQRLVALRIHLALAAEQLDRSEDRATLERVGGEVDGAIDELRAFVHGIYPPALARSGVGAALTVVAQRSAMPVRIRDGWRSRHPEAVEAAVYFCCLECLQNAAKHAGPGVSATISLCEDGDGVSFAVQDDGQGFDLSAIESGAGLTNLADRVATVGGTLEIDAGPGRGTRVTGRITAG